MHAGRNGSSNQGHAASVDGRRGCGVVDFARGDAGQLPQMTPYEDGSSSPQISARDVRGRRVAASPLRLPADLPPLVLPHPLAALAILY